MVHENEKVNKQINNICFYKKNIKYKAAVITFLYHIIKENVYCIRIPRYLFLSITKATYTCHHWRELHFPREICGLLRGKDIIRVLPILPRLFLYNRLYLYIMRLRLQNIFRYYGYAFKGIYFTSIHGRYMFILLSGIESNTNLIFPAILSYFFYLVGNVHKLYLSVVSSFLQKKETCKYTRTRHNKWVWHEASWEV